MDTTKDNNIDSDSTFQKQEQERDDITERQHTTDISLDNNTGSVGKIQTQE